MHNVRTSTTTITTIVQLKNIADYNICTNGCMRRVRSQKYRTVRSVKTNISLSSISGVFFFGSIISFVIRLPAGLTACVTARPHRRSKKKKWRYREWNENPLSIYVCRLQLYNGKRTAKKNTKVVEMMAEQQQQQKKKTSQTNTEDNPLNGQPNDNCCAQWN